jgi:hypothetical protein
MERDMARVQKRVAGKVVAKKAPQSAGGVARAQKLSAEERAEIARKAARSRWLGEMQRATHSGDLAIGETTIACAVLENGQRVLSQNAFLRAVGRRGNPRSSVVQGGDFQLPPFLAAENLKPFLPNDIDVTSRPVQFMGAGGLTYGYRAELLAIVCQVYQDARDAQKLLPSQYAIADACKLLFRGFATVGIVALVDEATGYQEVRDRLALREILNAYLRKELAAWAQRFPSEFYKDLFRLRNWDWPPQSMRTPQVVGKYTNNLVYARLAPSLLEELQQRNPTNEKGRRRAKHHMWLTDDVGMPALAQHLHAVIALMRASDSWEGFMALINRVFPVLTTLDDLPLFAEREAVAK